jgi:transposase
VKLYGNVSLKNERLGSVRRTLAHLFDVSRRAIYRLYDRFDSTSSFNAKKTGRLRGSALDAYKEQIIGWIDERADLTLEQLQKRCLDQLKLQVSIANVDKVIRSWGLRYKKNSVRQRAKAP